MRSGLRASMRLALSWLLVSCATESYDGLNRSPLGLSVPTVLRTSHAEASCDEDVCTGDPHHSSAVLFGDYLGVATANLLNDTPYFVLRAKYTANNTERVVVARSEFIPDHDNNDAVAFVSLPGYEPDIAPDVIWVLLCPDSVAAEKGELVLDECGEPIETISADLEARDVYFEFGSERGSDGVPFFYQADVVGFEPIYDSREALVLSYFTYDLVPGDPSPPQGSSWCRRRPGDEDADLHCVFVSGLSRWDDPIPEWPDLFAVDVYSTTVSGQGVAIIMLGTETNEFVVDPNPGVLATYSGTPFLVDHFTLCEPPW